jgi:hypothetical protein
MSTPAPKLSKRLFARQLYVDGMGYKAIARLLSLRRATVQMWRRRGAWQRTVSPSAQESVSPLPSPSAPRKSLAFYERELGISWQQMAGKSGDAKRRNLCLLYRRELPAFSTCYGLTGTALLEELHRLTAPKKAYGRLSKARALS